MFDPWVHSLAQGPGVTLSWGVGCRCSLDPVWLWRRLAAIAPIRPLAWEFACAAGAALKKKNHKIIKEETTHVQCICMYLLWKKIHIFVDPHSSNPCCLRVVMNGQCFHVYKALIRMPVPCFTVYKFAGVFLPFFFFFFLAVSMAWGSSQPGNKPVPQQQPELLQWQCWILNLLRHKGTPYIYFLIYKYQSHFYIIMMSHYNMK